MNNTSNSRVSNNMKLLKFTHDKYPAWIPVIETPYTHFPISMWNVGNEFNSTYTIQDREAGWVPGKFMSRHNCQNFLFAKNLGYGCR